MANFEGVTASNGAKIIPGKENEVEELLNAYNPSGEITMIVENGHISIYGYDWIYMEKVDEDGSLDCDNEDATEEFLEELAPLLEEVLVVHCIGNEKCRFPLGAMEIVVTPPSLLVEGGVAVKYGGFKHYY